MFDTAVVKHSSGLQFKAIPRIYKNCAGVKFSLEISFKQQQPLLICGGPGSIERFGQFCWIIIPWILIYEKADNSCVMSHPYHHYCKICHPHRRSKGSFGRLQRASRMIPVAVQNWLNHVNLPFALNSIAQVLLFINQCSNELYGTNESLKAH